MHTILSNNWGNFRAFLKRFFTLSFLKNPKKCCSFWVENLETCIITKTKPIAINLSFHRAHRLMSET